MKVLTSKGEKEQVLIYGASSHAKVIVDIVEKQGKYDIVGLLDDDSRVHGQSLLDYPILGGYELLEGDTYRENKIILAIGDNNTRKELWTKLKKLEYELACAIHPSAQIAREVSIGPGTVVMANTTINPGTEVGSNVIVNTGATIDHDCVIGNYVHISPGAHLAGEVQIGKLSHIGIGVSVIQRVKIGDNSKVGAGASVVDDIPDNVTAVGVPAKVIKQRKEGD